MITREQVQTAIRTLRAVAETIRELGEVPAGHLYAQLCDRMSLDEFESLIRCLVRNCLVAQDPSHLLRWVGPQPKPHEGDGCYSNPVHPSTTSFAA